MIDGSVILAIVGGVMIVSTVCTILFWGKDDADATLAIMFGLVGLMLFFIGGVLNF